MNNNLISKVVYLVRDRLKLEKVIDSMHDYTYWTVQFQEDAEERFTAYVESLDKLKLDLVNLKEEIVQTMQLLTREEKDEASRRVRDM